MAKDNRKRMSLAIEPDLVPWLDYMAGLESTNTTGHINRIIRREMEAAGGALLEGYNAFMAARAEAGTDEARA